MSRFWIVLLLIAGLAHGRELFVDPTLASNCGHYDAAAKECGPNGDAPAYSRLDEALRQLQAGDTLYLREGSYTQVRLDVSGRPDAKVTVSAYGDEDVFIRDRNEVGIYIANQSHIVIRGLRVSNSTGFGRLEEASNITIEGNDFFNAIASGTTGALKLVRASENRILGNTFDQGSDLLLLQDDSDRNLVEGNRFYSARHSLISIRCGNRNIIRDNLFKNPDQKAVEVFDCEGVSDAPHRLDSTVGNIIEKNRFFGTAAAERNHKFNAIQHGGQHTIVRYNLFSNNLGGGGNYQSYPDESLYVYGNRLYHNTFVNNRCNAIIGQDGSRRRFYDNVTANNLLYRNVDCGGRDEAISVRNRKVVSLENNQVAKSDPGFRSVADQDFCLVADSAAVDAAPFITRTRSAGIGNIVPVEDASWFSNGYGVVEGDIVRFEGVDTSAKIVAVDLAERTIELDAHVSWAKKQGVHLDFEGAAPDLGAREYGSADCEAMSGQQRNDIN